VKRGIERVIRREFSVEIRRKEEEIELINQVSLCNCLMESLSIRRDFR